MKPAKYLTDIKELPNDGAEDRQEVQTIKKEPMAKEHIKAEKPMPRVDKKNEKEMPALNPTQDGSEKRRFPLSVREMILLVINMLSFIFLVVLLTKLPQKALELKKIRTSDVKNEASIAFESDQVTKHSDTYEKLTNLFLDETGIVQFVNEVENLKGERNTIQKVTFTSPKAVKDRSGNYGIPVVIEMTGSWEDISRDLEHIQSLPFLFRSITFESKPNLEKSATVDLKYGILLYVKEELSKSK